MQRTHILLRGLLLVLLTISLGACDTFEDVFENELEEEGTIVTIDDAAQQLTLDSGVTYQVTGDTEWDAGLDSFDDLVEGLLVEIEYEEGDPRIALEIEDANAEDDD